MKIRLLHADNGDAIHLRTEDEEGKSYNILIDGGLGTTYINASAENKAGDLKNLINDLSSRGEYIDLLVLTHIDDDHIGGIIKWLNDDETRESIDVSYAENTKNARKMIKKVWFNSGRIIAEHFNKKEKKEHLLNYNTADGNNTSVGQGRTFEAFIEENNIWDRRILKNMDEIDLFGLKFTILSPSENKLKTLLKKWEKETPKLETSGDRDYSESLTELIKYDKFKEDTSIPNGSSIAFLVEEQGKKVLFLGDAHPKVVIDSLKSLGYSDENPLEVDYVKLSHHGSEKNTSVKLLELIKCERFLISSNGLTHNLPKKNCLARIIKNKEKPAFYFNYPELIEMIFTEQDYESFPNFTAEKAPDEIIV